MASLTHILTLMVCTTIKLCTQISIIRQIKDPIHLAVQITIMFHITTAMRV